MATERFMPGEQVGDFFVWETVHAGAQGVLYRATGPEPGFPMLLKVPRFQSGEAAESLLSYETEARILPSLGGPFVPRFVASGGLDDVPYLVMEHVAGHSLETEVAQAPLAADAVARLGAAIADALQSIHHQDCVHCDLKPDNILVRPDGRVALIDFGLAWHARFPDLLSEEKRFTAGSGPYLSPEQVLGVRGDPRSDLFSLGVILYELATGELPFGMPTTSGGLRQRLWMDPDLPMDLEPSVSPQLQEVILRLLEPDADKRYQSAAHVAFDLRNLGEVTVTQRPRDSARMKRWWKNRTPRPAASRIAPAIMVAVDTMHFDDERQPAIHLATKQLLECSGGLRLVCVSVVPAPSIPAEEAALHLEHMARLRAWTAPLALPPERLSLHVMVASDAAGALVEFARQNKVELIVLGAPRPGQEMLAWTRSVASGVTSNAPCSVHVVRVQRRV